MVSYKQFSRWLSDDEKAAFIEELADPRHPEPDEAHARAEPAAPHAQHNALSDGHTRN
jgi:hypothetical protein